MSKKVKSAPAPKPIERGDAACYVDKDGNVSNQALHDEIMEGVDPQVNYDFCREYLAATFTEEELDVLYPRKKGST